MPFQSSIMQHQKILIISHGIPHPSRGASCVLFYWYIHAIKAAGYSVLHVIIDTPRENPDEEIECYARAICADERFRVLYQTVAKTHFTSYRSLKIVPELPDIKIIEQARNFEPDVVVCFDINAAGVAQALGFESLVIWLGDLTYQTCYYHALYDMAADKSKVQAVPRALLSQLIWKRYYKDVLDGQSQVIVSSKSSEASVHMLGAKSVYMSYPWPDIKREVGKKKFERPSFAMFGTLAALGSRSAFHFLLKKVYPKLLNVWGDGGFDIYIAGARELPEWVKSDLESRPEFKFLGFVDDLTALVDQCHAVLAPISVPVGNRSRIVTALSMESVVIAHDNTALGNPELVSGENCYLASSAEEFTFHMRFAFENALETARISEAARLTYEREFLPRAACNRFIDFLEEALLQTSSHEKIITCPETLSENLNRFSGVTPEEQYIK